MPVDFPRIMPLCVAALAVLLIYRRIRRNFGRQRFSPVRMWIRIGILLFLGCSLLPAALLSAQFLAADLGGLVAGIALGLWGARLTRFEKRDGRLYYVPHTYSGIAVSLLLIGRLLYRMMFMYSASRAAGDAAGTLQTLGSPAMFQSPLTVGLLYVVVGYYLCYYGRVLWRSTRIGPEDLEVSATSIAVSPNEYDASSPGR